MHVRFSAANGDLACLDGAFIPRGHGEDWCRGRSLSDFTGAKKTVKEWGSVLNFGTGDAHTG